MSICPNKHQSDITPAELDDNVQLEELAYISEIKS